MANNAKSHNHHSPKQYIIGFILSIVLTIVALYLTENNVMSVGALIITILILAAAQVFVQLFFFMHINEKQDDGPAYNVMALILAAIFTIAIIGGSMWIMAFNSQVS